MMVFLREALQGMLGPLLSTLERVLVPRVHGIQMLLIVPAQHGRGSSILLAEVLATTHS